METNNPKKDNMITWKIVTWKKVADLDIEKDAFKGIMAVGFDGMFDPLQHLLNDKSTGFLSIARYGNGYALIAESTLIVDNLLGISETKNSLAICDIETIGDISYIISCNGEAIYTNHSNASNNGVITQLAPLNSIKASDGRFFLCGKEFVYVNEASDSDRKNLYRIYADGVNFVSGRILNEKECILLDDKGDLYYVINYKSGAIYKIAINEILHNIKINEIYTIKNDVYLLCNTGLIFLIKDFNIENINAVNNIKIYCTRIYATDWLSMTYRESEDLYVIVGSGTIDHSSIAVHNLPSVIINRDILNNNMNIKAYPRLVSMIDSEMFNIVYDIHDIDLSIDDDILKVKLEDVFKKAHIDNIDISSIDISKSNVMIKINTKLNKMMSYTEYLKEVDGIAYLMVELESSRYRTLNIDARITLGGDKE